MRSRLAPLTFVSLLLTGAFVATGFAAPGAGGPMTPAHPVLTPVANPAEPSPCGQPGSAADLGLVALETEFPDPQGCGACGSCRGQIGARCFPPYGRGICTQTSDICPEDGLWRCECSG